MRLMLIVSAVRLSRIHVTCFFLALSPKAPCPGFSLLCSHTPPLARPLSVVMYCLVLLPMSLNVCNFFPRFSAMISTLVFPPIPGTLAPSVANRLLTRDPLGRLFAVVLVSHYNPFPAYMFRSCFYVVCCRFLKYVLSCFPCCCFSLFFMYVRGKFRFLGDF